MSYLTVVGPVRCNVGPRRFAPLSATSKNHAPTESLRLRGRGWLVVAGGRMAHVRRPPGSPRCGPMTTPRDEAPQRPSTWPSATILSSDRATRPTLVVLAHPQCSCTRASLGELAEALARADDQTQDLRPVPEARRVHRGLAPKRFVAHGREPARRHGRSRRRRQRGAPFRRIAHQVRRCCTTQPGDLLFSGGITGARAHRGDNDGRRAIVALLESRSRRPAPATNVFGCSLFAPGSSECDAR